MLDEFLESISVNTGGVWTSLEGIHVWYETGNKHLHFPDGSY
jgi:hypothetical protein